MTDPLAEQGRVRPMTARDLPQVLQWRNHPDIRRYMYTRHEITAEEHRRWFERASADDTQCLLVFELDEIPLGFVKFQVLPEGHVADWGFYASPDAPPGTGRKLGQAALAYAFGSLQLHKVCGQALGFNERSIKFHLSLGFQQEGLLREQHFDGKDHQDVVCFGLLARDWHNTDGE
jgi:UDP-4-amino-4,6-dideoxy-N-acetyl-beta-L-altrosamine N-acetyltransferase